MKENVKLEHYELDKRRYYLHCQSDTGFKGTIGDWTCLFFLMEGHLKKKQLDEGG